MCSDIKDTPFLRLMAMGVYDWEGQDTELHQATRSMRYSAALASRMFPRILWNKEKVGIGPDLCVDRELISFIARRLGSRAHRVQEGG